MSVVLMKFILKVQSKGDGGFSYGLKSKSNWSS